MPGDFIMLVGLPASGKSTFAKQIAIEKDAVILSSDDIREEIFGDVNDQSNQSKVFETLNERTVEILNKNHNVIYDATNINRKRRKHLINHVIKANRKTVYYMNDHVLNIAFNDNQRGRTVGSSVINKMYKNMQIPVLNEGWDEVVFVSNNLNDLPDSRSNLENLLRLSPTYHELFISMYDVIPEFMDIYELPQDSTYHSFSVSRHTYHVYKYVTERSKDLKLLWTSLFHDVGKFHCKSFINYKGEESRYANFIGHEHVSSQLAAYYLEKLGYDDPFVKDVSALCQFHMMPMKAGEKKLNEVRQLLGDALFEDLMILHDADLKAK